MNNPNIPPLFKRSSSADETKPSDAAQTAAPSGATTSANTATSAPASALTADGLLKRLRYFENLLEQKEAYIEVLKAAITRQGGAVPSAYFAPLTGGEGGSHQPKSG